MFFFLSAATLNFETDSPTFPFNPQCEATVTLLLGQVLMEGTLKTTRHIGSYTFNFEPLKKNVTNVARDSHNGTKQKKKNTDEGLFGLALLEHCGVNQRAFLIHSKGFATNGHKLGFLQLMHLAPTEVTPRGKCSHQNKRHSSCTIKSYVNCVTTAEICSGPLKWRLQVSIQQK